MVPLSHLRHFQCMLKVSDVHTRNLPSASICRHKFTHNDLRQKYCSQRRSDDFLSDKIRHLCTCCCDTDLTIPLFTTFSDKEYALRQLAPPVKPGPPSARAVEKISEFKPHGDLNCFLTVIDLIGPRNNCRNNMCQSPWGALHPALHELRGYGWLKLYGMEGGEGEGHRCFSKAKAPLLFSVCSTVE